MKLEDWSPAAIVIEFTDKGRWPARRDGLPAPARAAAEAIGFDARPGCLLIAPAVDGEAARAFFGVEEEGARRDAFLAGKLAGALPAGLYRFDESVKEPAQAALAFLLSSYSFARYKKPKSDAARLCAPKGIDRARIERIASAVAWGRDLINTPANDMGPAALAEAALTLAQKHGAATRVVEGAALLAEHFPLIHAVGRASDQAPRLVEFSHGPAKGLKVTLVGKGVCFDSGGLNIKPPNAMALMKKDMGGAAAALALASMLMDGAVPVRLRVLLPIVENAISANAFRPGDVYRSRKGLTVEVGDTDAEGRLILADALAYACEDEPDLLFDFATLTGAARVALGPELPALFGTREETVDAVLRHGRRIADPLWPMPLWAGYDDDIASKIADVN
ncbi:MAG: leucyl aminopeptidase family protein, partial [Methylocystis sp.]|nr:leucyl aminopeptidase family protein [Methylocystis sp.]